MCCKTGNFSLYTVSDSIFGALFSIKLAWLWVLPALLLAPVCRGLVLMLVECPGMGVGALLGVLARTCSMSIHLLNIDESRETKRVWNWSGMGVLRVCCWQYRNLSLLQLSMSAGWSLDNCGKGGWVLKLVKDAILLAFYDILTQNLPSIYSCHVEFRSTFLLLVLGVHPWNLIAIFNHSPATCFVVSDLELRREEQEQ